MSLIRSRDAFEMSSWRYRPTRSPSRISSIGILLTEVLCLVGVFAVAAPHHLESVRQHQAFSISSTQGTTGPRTEHILHASTGCVRLQRPPLNPRVELVEVCEILRRTPFPYSLLPDQQCVAAKGIHLVSPRPRHQSHAVHWVVDYLRAAQTHIDAREQEI